MKFWREFVKIISGLAGELSHESPYRRHLLAHGLTHSPGEWRRFQDRQWEAESRRARCC